MVIGYSCPLQGVGGETAEEEREAFMLEIKVEPREGYMVCKPQGELDAFTVSQFRQALAELASSPRLVIDLSGVPFVDSAGLGALIGGIRRARELGGDVAVACNRAPLLRLLRTTGFDRIVAVADTIEEAAAAIAPSEGNGSASG